MADRARRAYTAIMRVRAGHAGWPAARDGLALLCERPEAFDARCYGNVLWAMTRWRVTDVALTPRVLRVVADGCAREGLGGHEEFKWCRVLWGAAKLNADASPLVELAVEELRRTRPDRLRREWRGLHAATLAHAAHTLASPDLLFAVRDAVGIAGFAIFARTPGELATYLRSVGAGIGMRSQLHLLIDHLNRVGVHLPPHAPPPGRVPWRVRDVTDILRALAASGLTAEPTAADGTAALRYTPLFNTLFQIVGSRPGVVDDCDWGTLLHSLAVARAAANVATIMGQAEARMVATRAAGFGPGDLAVVAWAMGDLRHRMGAPLAAVLEQRLLELDRNDRGGATIRDLAAIATAAVHPKQRRDRDRDEFLSLHYALKRMATRRGWAHAQPRFAVELITAFAASRIQVGAFPATIEEAAARGGHFVFTAEEMTALAAAYSTLSKQQDPWLCFRGDDAGAVAGDVLSWVTEDYAVARGNMDPLTRP